VAGIPATERDVVATFGPTVYFRPAT
jgi:hypothetical protein